MPELSLALIGWLIGHEPSVGSTQRSSAATDASASAVSSDDAAAASTAAWVEPVDGECPDGYPVKANDNSGIYHEPGGRFYGRTVPERCYARAEDAEADGYRAAKA